MLGLLWSYVQPLMPVLHLLLRDRLILGLHKNVPNFAIHVFAGLVVVHFFTETFNAGTRSIVRNKALVQKMAMPREMFPVASMLVSAFHVVPAAADPARRRASQSGWQPDAEGIVAGVLGLRDHHRARHRAGAAVQRR